MPAKLVSDLEFAKDPVTHKYITTTTTTTTAKNNAQETNQK
jgi:hypothetical protein